MSRPVNPGQSTSTAKTRRTDAAGRAAEALELRLSGLAYDEIAERLGYSDKSGAWRAVEGELREVRRERAGEVLDLDIRRLDNLLGAVWAKAMNGDPAAIDRVLKILERRARYFGLEGRADLTSAEIRASQELAYADVLARLAEIKDRMDGRLVAAVSDELYRMSKDLPVRDIPWEAAATRLEAFENKMDDPSAIEGNSGT